MSPSSRWNDIYAARGAIRSTAARRLQRSQELLDELSYRVLHDKGVEQAVVAIRVAKDPVGALFRIPVDHWTAISQRVGYTARLRNITDTVAEFLPQFPGGPDLALIW
jgi:hypothetical protein